MLYLLTPTSVFDHGCAGIFTDKAAAIAHAEWLYENSDGYHTIRVDEIPVDTVIDVSDTLRPGGRRPAVVSGGSVDFCPWEDGAGCPSCVDSSCRSPHSTHRSVEWDDD